MDRPEPEETSLDPRSATLALLARRAEGSTVCPSEVARAVAAAAGLPGWRTEMPAVHAAIDSMVSDGLVRLSWKGEAMPVRDGPYRIGRGAAVEEGRGS
ncbi:MAG TPA: DUF3253 domain-containing protein [Allosphingosinicella sp.]|jgi:hypothetical protein